MVKWAEEMAIKNRTRAGAFVLLVGIGLASRVLLEPGAVKAGSQADDAAVARVLVEPAPAHLPFLLDLLQLGR